MSKENRYLEFKTWLEKMNLSSDSYEKIIKIIVKELEV